VSIAERLPHLVKGDSESFKKLLAYFTSNAFKQSANVKVNIELLDAKEETSLIRIRIQDTGPGMSEDELDVHPCSPHSNVDLHMFRTPFGNLSRHKAKKICHSGMKNLSRTPLRLEEQLMMTSLPPLNMSEV
jgi:hypothetical protein